MPPDIPAQRGLTPRELARTLRVSPDRVRAWIASGELGAVDVGGRGKRRRFVILPHHVEQFERRRSTAPPPRPVRRRQKRRPGFVDYFPD
jgi:excisionase family DNA binding protein